MPTPKPPDPTPRQEEILTWIKAFMREHGMPPTVREIGRAFAIKSSSVFDLLTALQAKGYLRRGELGARSLILEGQHRHYACGCGDVPIVGRIAAGRPIEAVADERGAVAVGNDLLRGNEGFALQVAGNSMADAGILDGDYVIVRHQDTADNGDIVVALIEDEATLKRFFKERGGVRLEPASRGMSAIHVKSGQFRIQGKVVGVIRLMTDKVFREKGTVR